MKVSDFLQEDGDFGPLKKGRKKLGGHKVGFWAIEFHKK